MIFSSLLYIINLLEKGNTTTYEWIYGEPPLSISEPPLSTTFDSSNLEEKKAEDIENVVCKCLSDVRNPIFGESVWKLPKFQGIDFGDIDLSGEIDFGGDIGLADGGEIDWGDGNIEEVAPADIDYNVSLEESGIVVEAAGHEGGHATGTEAYTILDNPTTRSEFINDLFEVYTSHSCTPNNILFYPHRLLAAGSIPQITFVRIQR